MQDIKKIKLPIDILTAFGLAFDDDFKLKAEYGKLAQSKISHVAAYGYCCLSYAFGRLEVEGASKKDINAIYKKFLECVESTAYEWFDFENRTAVNELVNLTEKDFNGFFNTAIFCLALVYARSKGWKCRNEALNFDSEYPLIIQPGFVEFWNVGEVDINEIVGKTLGYVVQVQKLQNIDAQIRAEYDYEKAENIINKKLSPKGKTLS